MQPLSRTKRRLYLYGLTAIFLLCLPLVLLYVNGYRFKVGSGFVHTGSLIITVPENGGLVSMNGVEVGTSGFLRHNFYVDDLVPGSYQILVTREGDRPWNRTLVVEPELVTDAQAFLVPENVTSVRLVDVAKAASTTSSIPHAVYEAYRAAFLPTQATSTLFVSSHKPASEVLIVENGNVTVTWTDTESLPPSRFCRGPSACGIEIPIEKGIHYSARAEFFAGGVVYATKEGGVFLSEIDIRPVPVVVSLYPVRGADFRIVAGHLIVKDGTTLYEITGL